MHRMKRRTKSAGQERRIAIRKRNNVFRKGLVITALFLCLFCCSVNVFAKPKEKKNPEKKTEEQTKANEPATSGTSSANDGTASGNRNTEKKEKKEKDSESEPTSQTVTPPSGNLTLLEDVVSAVNGNREFLTVYSNDGHYFYIIIDRDNNGSGNVYFLNMVDDSDLYALTDGKNGNSSGSGLIGGSQKEVCICTTHCSEDKANENCPVCRKDPSLCEGTAEDPGIKPVEPAEEKSLFGLTGWKKKAVYVGLAAAVIAVILIFAISRKKKKQKGGTASIEITDYEDEFDEESEE